MGDTPDGLDATLPRSGPAPAGPLATPELATPELARTQPPRLSAAIPWTAESVPPFTETRFEPRDVLGAGGQGVVELAIDKTIGREVALKTLREASLTSHFLREARVTGQLEHPGIIPIYDIGRRADGSLICAQKLVRGRTLHQLLVEAPSREARLALLPAFVDVCQAVGYAHSRGVVHRDLKPANIMQGEFGETIVLDWGLARVLGEADAPVERPVSLDPSSTRVGQVVGTPLYMAPEQARGEEATRASDVWALGVILYELLAGRRPIEDDTVDRTLERVREGNVPPLSAIAPDVPRELVAVVERAMQRDPALRYPDAAALAAEVAAFRAGGKVTVYEYSSLELLRRFIARNKAAAVVFAAALVVASVLAFQWVSSHQKFRAMWALEVEQRVLGDQQSGHWNRATDRLGSLVHNRASTGDVLQQRLSGSLALRVTARAEHGIPLVAGALDAASHAYLLEGAEDSKPGHVGFSKAVLVAIDGAGRRVAGAALGPLPVHPRKSWLRRLAVDEAGTLAAIATGGELIFVEEPAGAGRVRRIAIGASDVQLSRDGRTALVHVAEGGCALVPTAGDDPPVRFACSEQVAFGAEGSGVLHTIPGPDALNVGEAARSAAPVLDGARAQPHLAVSGSVALAAIDHSRTLARRDLTTGAVFTAVPESRLDWVSACQGGQVVAAGTRQGVQFWVGERLAPAGYVDFGESPSIGRFRGDRCVLEFANKWTWYEIDATPLLVQAPAAAPSTGGASPERNRLDLQGWRRIAGEGAVPPDLGFDPEEIVAQAYSPCGNAVAVADGEGRLRFFSLAPEAKRGEPLPFVAPFQGVQRVDWQAGGLALVDEDQRHYFWPVDVCAGK